MLNFKKKERKENAGFGQFKLMPGYGALSLKPCGVQMQNSKFSRGSRKRRLLIGKLFI